MNHPLVLEHYRSAHEIAVLTMSDRIAVMSQGKVRQVGTPREIYDHPAERFVADFIGEANILRASWCSAEGGRGRVRLVGGIEVPARIPDGAPPSGASDCSGPPRARGTGPRPGRARLAGDGRERGLRRHRHAVSSAAGRRGAVRGAQPEHQRRPRRLRRPAPA